MAKDSMPLPDEEFYTYHNPITGQEKVFLRNRHNVIRSPRLEAYDECMREAMEGRRFRTGDAAADERAVHEAFEAAVARCKAKDRVQSKG